MSQSVDRIEPDAATFDVMQPRRTGERWGYNFIRNTFDQKIINFSSSGSYKLSIKLREGNDANEEHEGANEARAVYIADHVESGHRAVVKIRLQICPAPPDGQLASTDSDTNRKYALPRDQASQVTKDELAALQLFKDHGATHLPGLTATKWDIQTDSMPVPGGFLLFILMPFFPGVTFSRPYLRTLDEDDCFKILQAFQKASDELSSVGIEQEDKRTENLLYDVEKDMVYMVDFEVWHKTSTGGRVTEQILKDWQFPTAFINKIRQHL